MAHNTARWIGVNYHRHALHLWVMDHDDTLLEHRECPVPAPPHSFADIETMLLETAEGFLRDGSTLPAFYCGPLPGAPECPVPYDLKARSSAQQVPTSDPRLTLHIAEAVTQAKPADRMAGEETAVRGFLVQEPEFDGVLCIAGTQTKWVHISASEIVSFQSYMTLETYDALCSTATLSQALANDEWDDAAFRSALGDGMSSPNALTARMASLGESRTQARAQLLGLLIGLELGGARAYWLGRDVALIGHQEHRALYSVALQEQGLTARQYDKTEMILSGLIALKNADRETG